MVNFLDLFDITDLFGTVASLAVVLFAIYTAYFADAGKTKARRRVQGKPFPANQPLPDIKPRGVPGLPLPGRKAPAGQTPAGQTHAGQTSAERIPAKQTAAKHAPLQVQFPAERGEAAAHKSHRPMEYEEVHNPYQRYLESISARGEKTSRGDTVQKSTAVPVSAAAANTSEPANMTLVQAITAAEILGRPRLLHYRKRH